MWWLDWIKIESRYASEIVGDSLRPIVGARVFFKRRGWRRLRSYWCHRWDNPSLRQVLSRHDEPKYWVAREALSGYFVVLERLEFLWFRGLFSIGRHVDSGRYVRDPVHLPLRGLGPRELVFPISLTEQLDRVTLIGGWRRYQRSAGLDPEVEADRSRWEAGRLSMAVSRLDFGVPPPLLTWWGPAEMVKTLCLVGTALDTRLAGRELVVPLRELYWRELAGYSERYLRG
jgi:hypothetical protein